MYEMLIGNKLVKKLRKILCFFFNKNFFWVKIIDPNPENFLYFFFVFFFIIFFVNFFACTFFYIQVRVVVVVVVVVVFGSGRQRCIR